MFLNLGEVAYIGDVLWDPAAHSSLVTRAICSRGMPYVGCVGAPGPVGCQTLPPAQAAGLLGWQGQLPVWLAARPGGSLDCC